MDALLTMQPPRTIREVFDALPEGTRVQLIDNQLVMSPSPTFDHQKTLNEINILLLIHVEQEGKGEVIVTLYDVYLDVDNIFQPNIIYFPKVQQYKIHIDDCLGADTFVIELL